MTQRAVLFGLGVYKANQIFEVSLFTQQCENFTKVRKPILLHELKVYSIL